MRLLLGLVLLADGGASTLYSGVTREPTGLLQLELRAGAAGTYREVVSIHLPPAELEVLDVRATAKGTQLCLEPKPRAIAKCLEKKGDAYEATLSSGKGTVLLERR